MIDRHEAATRRAAQLREAWKDDDIVVLRLRPPSIVRVWSFWFGRNRLCPYVHENRRRSVEEV